MLRNSDIPPWFRRLLTAKGQQPPQEERKRDFWDKAPIIASIFSSVVIALVGLYVSSTFQSGQLAVTRENNAAQLAITSQRNQADIRLAELKLASELLESLVSQDAKKRRIATLMLPSALSNQQMTQQILAALTDDPDQNVRVAAINKLGTANTQQAALALERVHSDPSRPPGERELARDLATKVALNSNLPPNTAFLFASAPGGLAYEKPSLKGGVFTHFLVKGLAGDADYNGDGKVTIQELARYVDTQVPSEMLSPGDVPAEVLRNRDAYLNPLLKGPNRDFRPFLELSGSPDLEVAALRNADKRRRIGLVVGVAQYAQAELQLQYAVNDAEYVTAAFRQLGVDTTTLINPTGAEIASTLQKLIKSLAPEDNFYFYFSGHGWSTSGENMLGPTDIKRASAGITGGVSIETLKGLLQSAQVAASFAFFDVCRNEVVVTR